MNSIEEDLNDTDENLDPDKMPLIKRRSNKIQTQKTKKLNLELLYQKVGKVKQRFSLSTSHRMNSLTKLVSSKIISPTKRKSNKGILDDMMISDLIDPSYNFSMNYQLKETALKIFQSGLEGDQTKVKFFCNYLYQLVPFNKNFAKLTKSKNPQDINKLERILYNLSLQLKYEYVEKNKIVYLHGDYPDKYYIILKGEVDIIIPNEMEVMMTEYEYYYYILRLYRYQEHSLLEKVLDKNYDIYRLDIKLLEDWIQTGFNTLINLEKESELNKLKRKKKNKKTYTPAYSNTTELINHLEKQKKLNLLMLSQNVILLLEKIRIRNEKARDAKKLKALKKKKKESKKKQKSNAEENIKPNVQYIKLNGQMKKIFVNEDQVEVVEKCSSEISQLMEMKNEEFNFQKYLKQLNRTEPDKYINRVKPIFFDEDTNDILDPKQFIVSKSEKNENETKQKVEEDDENDTFMKLRTLFGYNKSVDTKKRELFNNRKKLVVYNYVLVNSSTTGETFGEIIYEGKQEKINPRIATIITKENCHFASLKKNLYNKILKEFNENNLHHQFLFLYSLDIFKDCNKNTFMKNMSFFIKRTIRANEILFNQDDNFGEDRSIYFVENGTFTSYCNISINDIEALFNNLNYVGLILPDDAHEDNLFNKENHDFCNFKNKKNFLNLFTFSKRDIIGFDDALYDQKYIYTVKCQSEVAIVYEIKLKFFNLIVNSETKLYQVLERYEAMKRNIMMKFFLNAYNNKTNFYKFISFDNLESEREDKKIVHKNYFGKNPFIEEKSDIDIYNKTNFKTLKTLNKVNDNIVELMPELKKSDIICNTTRLNSIKKLTKSSLYDSKTFILPKNQSNFKTSFLSSSKSINKFQSSSRNLKRILEFNSEKFNRTLKKKLSGIYSNKKVEKLKIDIYNSNNDKNDEKKNTFPIIMHTLPKNQSKNGFDKKDEILSSVTKRQKTVNFNINEDNNNSKPKNNFNTKSINKYNSKEINKNNEYSVGSSIISDSFFKGKSIKTKEKSLIGFKKYLKTNENNIELKNQDELSKNDEIRLKCYLKDIPDFFDNNKNSKKIFFGMNNKTLYQNNILFTDYK